MRALVLVMVAQVASAQVAGLCGAGRVCNASRYVSPIPTASSEIGPYCLRNPNGNAYMFDGSTNGVISLKYDTGATNVCPRPGLNGTAWSHNTTLGHLSVNSSVQVNATASYAPFCFNLNTQSGYSWGLSSQTSTMYLGGYGAANSNCSGTPSTSFGRLSFSLNGTDVTSVGPLLATKFVLNTSTTAANFTDVAGSFQTETAVTGARVYFRPNVTTGNTLQPYDLGGHAHPVLQGNTYSINTASAPAFMQTAPLDSGNAASTITTVNPGVGFSFANGVTPHLRYMKTWATPAVINNFSSMITSTFVPGLGYAPRFSTRVQYNATNTLQRDWLGMASALPGSSDAPAATHHVSFRRSTNASDTVWQACYGAGAGTTCVTTGVTVATSTMYTLMIDCRSGTECVWWVNGTATNRVTSGLPTAAMAPFVSVETLSGASRSLDVGVVAVEVN